MIGPAYAAAMLLAGAPANPGGMQPAMPAPSAPPAASDRALRLPPAPAISFEPRPPAAPPETAAPATGPAADQGEIVVTGQQRATPGDPLEQLNAQSFEVTQSVDKAVVRPAAKAYTRIVPDPVRAGVRNFLNNLRQPVIFLNYMLQLKPGKAAETVGRFAINSTIGVAGLVDVAKKPPFNLPHRPNGFANTLGYYGVKPGPFLFLPLVGPTTVRDFIGDGLDRLVVPLAAGRPFNDPVYSLPLGTLSSVDQRAQFDEKLQALHGSADPYVATREDYLRTRQAAIDELRGKRPGAVLAPAPGLAKPEAD